MKRLTLGTIEWGRTTIDLITIHYDYSNWGVELLKAETFTYIQPYWHKETTTWYLFKLVKYSRSAMWQTIRADFVLFGRAFAWKRTVPDADDLPF